MMGTENRMEREYSGRGGGQSGKVVEVGGEVRG